MFSSTSEKNRTSHDNNMTGQKINVIIQHPTRTSHDNNMTDQKIIVIIQQQTRTSHDNNKADKKIYIFVHIRKEQFGIHGHSVGVEIPGF